MSIYSKKQRWKIILLILAILIIISSLWYSNRIASKIKKEEKQKVELWSQAIKEKTALIVYTQDLFEKLREQERMKIEVWSDAQKILISPEELDDYTFVSKVVTYNTTIPVIVVDQRGKKVFTRNLDPERENDPAYIDQVLEEMKSLYPPFEVDVAGEKQYFYYKDSNIITELEKQMDNLINSFISETVINSASVPVILTGADQIEVIDFGNIDSTIVSDPDLLSSKLNSMRAANNPIEVDLGSGNINYIFYEDSLILKQLKFYPLIQFIIIGLFLLIAYLLFSTFRKAEQNQVWVGLAKETAHQLGTPLSSLMAWTELLKSKNIEPSMVDELNKDVDRLETITNRFSKIGSQPELEKINVFKTLNESIKYLKPRVSSKVKFELNDHEGFEAFALLNKPLFGWVIENLCKNAIDAMNGEGTINLNVVDEIQMVYIDITDDGKGLPSKLHKRIFQPGFTTKKRGWGLGLSLSKRIIENYHEGKIFVKRSEVGKGTTFRIVLNK